MRMLMNNLDPDVVERWQDVVYGGSGKAARTWRTARRARAHDRSRHGHHAPRRRGLGVARGVAKATLFGLTNPEAAVRLHWKLFPASKPQSGDDARLLEDALHVFDHAAFVRQARDYRP